MITASNQLENLGTSRLDRRALPRSLHPMDETLSALFEQVTTEHSFRPAILSEEWNPTYEELNAAANRLAHAIIARGGAPSDRVVVLMEHDGPAIGAILAVLKAGRIVVALNPKHSPARLRELISHSEPSCLITDSLNAELALESAHASDCFIRFEEASREGITSNPSLAIDPAQAAFLTYTSGSTGKPKGVLQTHRQRASNATVFAQAMQLTAEDRLPLFASLSSGQACSVTFSALLTGATLLPFALAHKGVAGLYDWITENHVTAYVSAASVFRNFIKAVDPGALFPHVHAVQLMSEPATSDDFKAFQRHFPANCCFVHTLSSSETANIALSRWMQGDNVPEGQLPVGLVTKEHEITLCDEHGAAVAPGEIGEIFIKSRYIANGYWRNPELTAERFSTAADGSGDRIFRTGDLARINDHGCMEVCGRRDDQRKIRGTRIELSAIERALQRLPGIDCAIVETVPRAGREPALVGFVIFRGEQCWSQPELRRALRAALPDHMVPSEFTFLKTFPLTSNGKVDREKLRQDYRPERHPLASQRPETPTESLLAIIWGDVLAISDVGRDEDFFALGGDSLMAALIAARLHDAVGVKVNLVMFTNYPTVAKLAPIIDALRGAEPDDALPLAPAACTLPLPMSFAQERTWKFSRTPTQSAAYTMAQIYRILGPLNVELLRECMDYLSRRHEILRTTFAQRGGHPIQVINPSVLTPLQSIDLSDTQDPKSQANAIFKKEAASVFDLTRGPLYRFFLVRLRENEYWLLRVSHHIISDNVSWVLYLDELALLYGARLRGEAPPLSESAPLQYGDYAVWQRKVLGREGMAYRQAILWWKKNLSGAPSTLRLPFTRVQEEVDVTPTDGMMSWGIERQISHRLNVLGSVQRVTRSMVRLAAFAALLAIETRESDVSIGMYATGRTRLLLRNVIGDFTNIITLRFQYDPTKSFVEWLSIVRDQVVRAETNSAIPYEELREKLQREDIYPPDIQVIFHISLPRRVIEFEGLSLTWLDRARQSFPWGFTMDLDDQNEEDCHVFFDPRIYEPAGVREFIERYKHLLDIVSLHPKKTLDELVMIS